MSKLATLAHEWFPTLVPGGEGGARLPQARFSLKDQVYLAKRLSYLITASVSIVESLHILRDQARAKEQGGMSGRPLFRLSTRMVAETYVRAEGAFPLIGAVVV